MYNILGSIILLPCFIKPKGHNTSYAIVIFQNPKDLGIFITVPKVSRGVLQLYHFIINLLKEKIYNLYLHTNSHSNRASCSILHALHMAFSNHVKFMQFIQCSLLALWDMEISWYSLICCRYENNTRILITGEDTKDHIYAFIIYIHQ